MRLRGRGTVDAVTISDPAGGVVYTVAPALRDGIVELWHYAETAIDDVLPEVQDKPLPRAYLAEIAMAFLEGKTRGAHNTAYRDGELWMAFGVRRGSFRPDSDARQPRPDDETLVALVRRYQNGHRRGAPSARVMLAQRFNIKPYTADDWIRRARDLAPDAIEPPTTGRGHKRITAAPDEGNER